MPNLAPVIRERRSKNKAPVSPLQASPQLAFFYFAAGFSIAAGLSIMTGFSRSESNTGRVTGGLSGEECT